MTASEQNEQNILAALRQVIDPEIGCNIVDLGLVYSYAFNAGKVTVAMTLPRPAARCTIAFRGA